MSVLWFFTCQGLIKAPVKDYEWFQTSIVKPDLKHLDGFKSYQKSNWGEGKEIASSFERSVYDYNHGLSDEEAHHVTTFIMLVPLFQCLFS